MSFLVKKRKHVLVVSQLSLTFLGIQFSVKRAVTLFNFDVSNTEKHPDGCPAIDGLYIYMVISCIVKITLNYRRYHLVSGR